MNATLDDFDLSVNYNAVDLPYEWKLKITNFANNTVDLVMQKIKHVIPKTTIEPFYGIGVSYPKTLTDEELEAKKQENILRAVRRAKKAVHYAIRQISGDHLLTLTTRENITDREKFFQIFTRFIRLVRNKQLVNGRLINVPRKSYAYVAVPEFQTRGAFHMHCVVHGKQDIKFLRACWYVALGGSPFDRDDNVKGAIDVQYRQKRFGRYTDTYSTMALVNYLTKYIDKDFANTAELGQHRYLKARDIPKPIESRQFVMACNLTGHSFVDAFVEVSKIAEFITGVHPTKMDIWNRGQDILIIRSAFLETL